MTACLFQPLRLRVALRVAVCAALICFTFLEPKVWAQTPPADSIVITGTRTPTRVSQQLADVSVISRAQIDAATGRTLPELLAQQAGVQFWSNGGVGKVGSVSLRGLEARHTLLLVDGVRVGSATTGTPTWETVPLDSIERIEIVRGPLSGLYGSDAVGGVVQIFTRKGVPGLVANGSATVGSHRTAQLTAGVGAGQGPFDGALQLSHSRTRGISATNPSEPFDSYNADTDGFKQSSVTARLGWAFAPGWRADVNSLVSRGTTQLDDGVVTEGATGASNDAKASVRAQLLGLQVAGTVMNAPAGPWRTALRASRGTDVYDTLASASPYGELGAYTTVQQQLAWENTVATPVGTALLLLERLQQRVSKPGDPYDVSQRTVTSLALGLDGSAGVHSWQASLRRDNNSQFGRPTTGSAAYGLELVPGLRAGLSWGSSFVAPSFNQLYYPGFSNPALQPETGLQREASLRWQTAGNWGAVTTRVAYVDNRIRGFISSGPQPTNLPRTRIDGLTASVDAQLGAWALVASADSFNPVNTTPGARQGKLLPNRVQDSARLAADHTAGAWKLGATLAAHDERYADSANTTRLGGYATLDLRADWALARAWALGLRLNNAGGKTYETLQGYNQPGRELMVSLRYSGP
jgi:vitamin B12 transporter